ncbi:MAG: cytochrome c/FTR1 family iron permease [Acidobacteria bacterium]|nr:cytochrome c/FTR1 family iron permease [Acidobacteriota bacterium]
MKLNRRLLFSLTFLPVFIGLILLFVPVQTQNRAGSPLSIPLPQDSERLEPEKLVFLLQYLGTDYAAAVQSGQVISEFEYQEMLDFSQLLVEQYRQLDPAQDILTELQLIRTLIEEKRDWIEVRGLTHSLLPRLSQDLNVVSYPAVVPSLSRGKRLFLESCAKCHGLEGDGRGPSAAELDPPPRSFQDQRMNQLAPHQLFNALTFGVEGTEMPSHLESLSHQERWDIAFYIMTLRNGFDPVPPKNSLGVSLKALAIHSNEELIAQLANDGVEVQVANLDYYRKNPPGASLEDLLVLAEQRLRQSLEAYRRGEVDQALNLALDAYLEGIEPVEPALAQRDRSLAAELEGQFAGYRLDLRNGASAEALSARFQTVQELTKLAGQALSDSETVWGFAFVQSLAIILREGMEAALLLALMVTYLAAAGYQQLQKFIAVGVGAALLLGIATWWLTQFALRISPLQQEALEGLTSLLAAAVLFSVSFWVIRQVDIRNWKEYIRKKAEQAMGRGSGLTLASVAFLVVYREAVETILFYEALWMRSESDQGAILVGFVSGTLILLSLVFVMFKLGLRIPLKPFFAITGVLLGMLAFVFAGYGVRELQTIGWLKETPLDWMVSISVLEIRATLETTALQLGILLSFLMGWLQLSQVGKRLTADR